MDNSLKFFEQRKNMKNIAQFANPMKILQGLRKSQNTLQKFHNLVKIHYENIAKISQPCKNALRKCPVKILANTEKPCEIFDRVAKSPTVTPHLFKPPPMFFFFISHTPSHFVKASDTLRLGPFTSQSNSKESILSLHASQEAFPTELVEYWHESFTLFQTWRALEEAIPMLH